LSGITDPPSVEDKLLLLDARLGEDSPFHTAFGFYVEGIHKDVVVLPKNWDNRLVHFVVDDDASTRYGRTGLCLDPVDLCVSKTIAGREKDYEFVAALVTEQLVTATAIQDRIASGIDWPPTYTEDQERSLARAQSWLDHLSSRVVVRSDGSRATPTSPPTAGPEVTAALPWASASDREDVGPKDLRGEQRGT